MVLTLQIRRGRTRMLAVGALCAAAWPVVAQNELFPNTRERGRAAIEFRDDKIQAVAAYYYSQRAHDSRWLLVEFAVSTERRMTFGRDHFSLQTPAGRDIPLAEQARLREDIQRTRLIVQNASTQRHDVGAYFTRRPFEEIRFFVFPFDGTVLSEFVVDEHRIATGDLFFESPTGLWEPGTYRLIIQQDDVRAELPIELE